MGKGLTEQRDVSTALRFWQERIAAYVKEKRRASGKAQKQVGARQTISLIEGAKYNFTLEQLLETLEAIDGDISEAFRGVPMHFSNSSHKQAHEQLQDILENAPPRAQAWIVGNIETFHENYVSKRR